MKRKESYLKLINKIERVRGVKEQGLYLCKCGTEKILRIYEVDKLKILSCGCYQKIKENSPTLKHGDSGTNLYSNWKAMRARSKKRIKLGDDCKICVEWDDFEVFKKWSLGNGFKDGLCLCRTLDMGNYEPGNVRWDTRSNNTKETAVNCRITDPYGSAFVIRNLGEFCKEHKLNRGHMGQVALGNAKQHKGYTVEYLYKNNEEDS